MIDKRNADYLEITRRLEFPIDAPVLSSVLDEEQLVSISASIFETDVLIWLVGPNHGPFIYCLLTDSLGRFVFCKPAPPMFSQPQKISIIESTFLTPRSASSLATTYCLIIATHSRSMTK